MRRLHNNSGNRFPRGEFACNSYYGQHFHQFERNLSNNNYKVIRRNGRGGNS